MPSVNKCELCDRQYNDKDNAPIIHEPYMLVLPPHFLWGLLITILRDRKQRIKSNEIYPVNFFFLLYLYKNNSGMSTYLSVSSFPLRGS